MKNKKCFVSTKMFVWPVIRTVPILASKTLADIKSTLPGHNSTTTASFDSFKVQQITEN